jgi:hypothetical protein
MNTKLTFYCTHCQYGRFEKVIFETVLSGTPFQDIDDTRNWIDDRINELYYQFGFDLVFDWVAMNYVKTNEPESEVKIIKTTEGRLSFEDDFVNSIIDNKNKVDVNSDVDDNSEIGDLNHKIKLLELELEKLKEEKELIEINNKIDKLKKENAELEEKIKKKKEKKDYTSAWIDPSGKKYVVAFSGHDEFAFEWLKSNDPKTLKEKSHKYNYELLQDKGWIRILGWTDTPTFVIEKVTPKQKITLRQYCISENVHHKDWPEILKS